VALQKSAVGFRVDDDKKDIQTMIRVAVLGDMVQGWQARYTRDRVTREDIGLLLRNNWKVQYWGHKW
jgi:hypothetical protein